MLSNQPHKSVLLDEVIHNLNIKGDGNYLDLTVGFGGHSQHILEQLTTGTLTGNDMDKDSITFCTELFKDKKNVVLVHDNFANFFNHLKQLKVTKFDGILIDLGVSSYQLNKPERGFSFKHAGPFDMRMHQSDRVPTALDILERLSEEELTHVLKKFGEIAHPKPIAKALKTLINNTKNPTTVEVAETVKAAASNFEKYKSRNYLAKVFQAIRIYLNRELESLEIVLQHIPKLLNNKGRFLVIVFHSLEEKLVRNYIFKLTHFVQPPELPVKLTPPFELITKKPILPTEQEIKTNPRVRSAKLFVIEKK